MDNIKHIFWDLDNTLWDYRANSSVTLESLYGEFEIEKKFGTAFSEFHEIYKGVNDQLWEWYRNQEISKDELLSRRFPDAFEKSRIPSQDFSEKFNNQFHLQMTNPGILIEGAEEILEYLNEKYQMHVLSNGFEEITNRKINTTSLKKYIQSITTSEGAGVPKPDPKAFWLAMENSGASVQESLYIGDDWIADMIGATNFGMKAIFFNPLHEKHEWIDGVPIIYQLKELKKYL